MATEVPHFSPESDEESLRQYAATVLGSHADSERWFNQPALALDYQRPVDLLATASGRELVRTILGRIEFGVYT